MNLPIEQFIPSGTTAVGGIISIVAIWFKFQNKVENLEKEDSEQARQIEALWKWKDEHTKESGNIREHLNRDIAEIRATALVVTEQFKQILEVLSEIKERLTFLEKNRP